MSNNIYKKLAEMRVELQNCDIKKSGYNDYGKYNYYEMADFLPYINEIAKKHDVFNLYELQAEKAILKVIDLEEDGCAIEFSIPIAEIAIKGANSMQNIGGVTTYTRRYLYMIAYEIAENDTFDAQVAEPEPEMDPNKIPVNETHVATLKATMEKKGVPESKILERVGKDKLEDMTMLDFMKSMEGLKKTPDAQEQKVDLGL